MDQTKSPFPGMDPYLEQHWLDVHHRLCTYACDAIQPMLRPGYVARMNERVFVEEFSGDPRVIHPDVRITRHRKARTADEEGTVATLDVPVAEPELIAINAEPIRQGFIEIRERGDIGRLITVIEFVSSTNKLPGEGRKLYRRKRAELYRAGVNLVEIDLTRQGNRELVVPSIQSQTMHQTYFACIFRSYRSQVLEGYGISIREPLPNIAIPLRKSAQDVVLRLQPLVDLAYARGAYGSTIDYTKPAAPPLRGRDAVWAKKLLITAGTR